MRGRPVCALSDLEEGGARGVIIQGGDGIELPVILVRKGSKVLAYRNACPHTGINLEWLPDQFFDGEGRFLQCSMHGALFRPEDGYCLRGPCAGDFLDVLSARVVDGQVMVFI